MRTDRRAEQFVSQVIVAAGLAVALLVVPGSASAQPGTPGQTPAAGQPPAAAQPAPGGGGQEQGGQAAPAAQNQRVFASDAGLVLNFIKADKTAEFEDIVAKLKDALGRSDKPERRQQAASWKVYRALEPGANGSVLYVFEIDPAVHGADYTVSTILAEGFPDQVQQLFQQYADAYAAGQNVVNLKLVASLGQ